MKKQTTKFCALLLSLLTLISTITFNSLTVFAAESDKVQNETTSQNTNAAEDEEISFYGATGDRTLEEPLDDSITTLTTPNDYYKVLNENSNNDSKKLKTAISYPDSVDNSTSEYFPEVRSQGSIGSCVAWAQTYYQFTYTMNKQLGRKTTLANTFSPKWTFNFAMISSDSGSYSDDVYDIMKTQGVATWSSVPYDNDCLSWSPKENIWKEALNYRLKSYNYISYGIGNTPITGANDPDLNTIKAALSNGELLTYSTYAYSWNYKKIQSDNRVPENDKYSGQSMATNMTGYQGSHRMTIVGYNNNIWVDINENNIVEDNEMGAFKVVNSWGTNYCNNGFAWVSYDALNKVSSVEGVKPNSNRGAIFNTIARIDVEPYDSGSGIYLKYTLNSAARKETPLYIEAEKNGEVVSATVAPYNVIHNNAICSYDGTTNSNDGTMLFDLGNVIPNLNSTLFDEYTWSVKFTDENNNSNILTVKDAEIVDENTNKTYKPSNVFPFSLNGDEKYVKFKETNLNNAVIYYRGYQNPNIHYKIGNGSWTNPPGIAMKKNIERYGYTHKYIIELGDSDTTTLCFNDGNGNWDNNNQQNYIAHKGLNYFITENAYVPPIQINLTSDCKNDNTTSVGIMTFFNAKVTGGYAPYKYQFVYENLNNGKIDKTDYSDNYNVWYKFMQDGEYKVTVNVKDYSDKVMSKSMNITAKTNYVHFTSFSLNTSSPIILDKELTFSAITEDEKMSYPKNNVFNLVIKKDNIIVANPSVSINNRNLNKGISSVSSVWTPTEIGDYTATISVIDNEGYSAEKTLHFTVVENKLTIYYKGYSTPYIHYQIGNGNWTAVPGSAMTATNEVSGYTHKYTIALDEPTANICFNDGKGNWDNNNGANYKFEAGTYTYSNGNISKYIDDGSLKFKSFDITPANGKIKVGEYVSIHIGLENSAGSTFIQYAYRDQNNQETVIHDYSTASGCSVNFSTPGIYTLIVRAKSNPYDTNIIYTEKTVIVSDKDEADDEITIYYKGYSTPYIHYQAGNGNWTDVPGCAMTATNELSGYTHKYTINLGEAEYAYVCFNDGNGNWDSNNGNNYRFDAGTYTYSNGKISRYFDDGALKIKSFDITPTDGKINAGEFIDIKIALKNSPSSPFIQYAYRDSNGYENTIHDYSTASGCSNQFTQAGTYTLIVRVKSTPYSTDVIYAEKTIIVS